MTRLPFYIEDLIEFDKQLKPIALAESIGSMLRMNPREVATLSEDFLLRSLGLKMSISDVFSWATGHPARLDALEQTIRQFIQSQIVWRDVVRGPDYSWVGVCESCTRRYHISAMPWQIPDRLCFVDGCENEMSRAFYLHGKAGSPSEPFT